MRFTIVTVVAILLSETAAAAEPLQWVKKPELTFDEKARKWYATFELDALTDVEVAIVDPATNAVVRHLAAAFWGRKHRRRSPRTPVPRSWSGTARTITALPVRQAGSPWSCGSERA